MRELLIIDDDPLLRKAIMCVFEGGYQVRGAASAEESIPMVASSVPDLVLLDLSLSGMNGLDYMRYLHAEYPHLPVVMISGVASGRQAVALLEAGAADFIRKPFDVDELRLRVARALQQADLQRRVRDAASKPRADRDKWEPPEEVPLKDAVEQFERARIERALAACDGVVSRAAEKMGTTRRILQYRIQKLGIG